MQVAVRLSAGLAREVGQSRLQVCLADGASVADLTAQLLALQPSLATQLRMAVPVIAGSHVAPSAILKEGDEVALLLPIAGGSQSQRPWVSTE